MASNNYGLDRLLWQFTLDSSNDTLVLESSNSGTFTADLGLTSETIYMNHFDSLASPVPGQPFLFRLVQTINSAAPDNQYDFESITPNGSDLTGSGVALVRTSGTAQFRIRWDAENCTLPRCLLGYERGRSTASPWSDANSPTGQINSPLSICKVWHSPHKAHEKRRDPMSSVARSDDTENAYNLPWERKRDRMLHYVDVYGALVWPVRANDATLASQAGLPTGDINNGFYDFWDQSARKGESFVIVHNEGEQDLYIDSHPWELAYMNQQDQMDSFREILEDIEGKERYWIKMDYGVDAQAENYSH